LAESKIQAVLFDLGETLLNFGMVDTGALFREAGRLSYDYLKQLNQPVVNFNRYLRKNLFKLYYKRLIASITENDFDSLAVLKNQGTKMGVQLTPQQWEHFNWLWYEPLYKKASAEPDISETLTTLTRSGIKLGIVSNTFVNAFALDKHLSAEELLGFFDVRLYSYQYSFRKPDKRIFLEAARMIGASPSNIMFVGDRIDKDVKGALNAGMLPVLKKAYTNDGKSPPDGTVKIERISELPGLIQKINGQK
jgi:HAD superfamily hydrolase (TIGR01549 family)